MSPGVFKDGLIRPFGERWRIVDRSDRDGGSGHIGVRSTVIGSISKGVRAVEIRIGRVGEGAVGIEGEGAVCRADDLDSGKRITVHVGVVSENARCSHIKHRVLIGAVGVLNSDRRMVYRNVENG